MTKTFARVKDTQWFIAGFVLAIALAFLGLATHYREHLWFAKRVSKHSISAAIFPQTMPYNDSEQCHYFK